MIPRPIARAVLALWILVALGALIPCALGLGGGVEGGNIALEGERLFRLGRNSLQLAATTVLIAALLAIPAALAAKRLLRSRASATLLLLLGTLPLFVAPPVLAVVAVRTAGPQGFATKLLIGDHLTFPVAEQINAPPSLRPAPVYTLTGAAATLAVGFAPVLLLAACAALARGDRAAEEAAMLDAAPTTVLVRVTVPRAAAGIFLGCVLVFLFSFTEFGVPESLRSLPVLVSEVYVQFGVAYDPAAAFGASLVLVLGAGTALVAAVALLRRLLAQEPPESEGHPSSSLFATRGSRVLMLLRIWGWLAVILPLAVIVGVLTATAQGPQGRAALWIDTWHAARQEVLFSLGLGLGAALLAAFGGWLLAVSLWRLRRPWVVRALLLAPLIVPGPVYGVALGWLLRRPPGSLPLGLDDALATWSETLGPLLFVWTAKFAPLVAVLVEASLRQLPSDLLDALRLEGLSIGRFWRHFGLRTITPAIGAGALCAFALSLGEVGAAVLLLPPGPTTLGVRLLTLMHYAPQGQVSALCLLLLIPGLVAAALGLALLAGRRRFFR